MAAPNPKIIDFAKENIKEGLAGKVGKTFLAFDLVNLATSENKFKSVLKILRDLIFTIPIMRAGFTGLFLGMQKGIRSIVHDTGSLDAALKKLAQIQSLQKVFAPLVGGAAAAKVKVAELVNFAASRNLKLGETADAEHALQIMTKGSFAGAGALDQLNDVAKSTGNNITDVADAVGKFNADLQGGASIEGASEQLRQMGVVSSQTADQLINLQKAGASNSQIFGVLTDSFMQFKGGAEAAADSVEEVNKAFETAKENISVKFGSPFVQSDIQNTKNYTAALNAIAPSVEKISQVWAIFANGLSTAKSSFVEWIATSSTARGTLEFLAKALTGIVAIAGVISGVQLGKWFLDLAAAIASGGAGATGLTAKLAQLAGTGVVGSIAKWTSLTAAVGSWVTVAAAAAGVAIGLRNYFEQQIKAMAEMDDAIRQSNDAMARQIANARTLADRHNAIATATEAVTAAQVAYNKALEDGNATQVAAAAAAVALAQKQLRHANAIKVGALEPSEEEKQAAQGKAQADIERRESAFQAKMESAKPAEQRKLLAQHAEELAKRTQQGAVAEKARLAVAKEAAALQDKIKNAQQVLSSKTSAVTTTGILAKRAREELENTRDIQRGGNVIANPLRAANEKKYTDALMDQKNAAEDVKAAQMDLDNLKKSEGTVGINQPKGTSVQLEAQRRALLESTDPDRERKAAQLVYDITKAKIEEEKRWEYERQSIQEKGELRRMIREQELNKMSVRREFEIQNLATKTLTGRPTNYGDLGFMMENTGYGSIAKRNTEQGYGSIKGRFGGNQADTVRQQTLEDLSMFADKLKDLENVGFAPEEATKMAQTFSDNAISMQNSGIGTVIADSMQRIGGGGGTFTQGDKTQAALERQIRLHEEEVSYLREIAGLSGNEGVQ